MARADIEFEVGKALQSMVENDLGLAFSYALVPAKSQRDGGLGQGWNAWLLLLEGLAARHLPQKWPYTKLSIGVKLVDETHAKDLRSARYRITERLMLIQRHNIR